MKTLLIILLTSCIRDHGIAQDTLNPFKGDIPVHDPVMIKQAHNYFMDKYGKGWLFYGSYKAGLRCVQVDPLSGKLINDPPQLTVITKALGEGVFIIKGEGYYYIFASRGICCKGMQSTYQVVIGRS